MSGSLSNSMWRVGEKGRALARFILGRGPLYFASDCKSMPMDLLHDNRRRSYDQRAKVLRPRTSDI